MGELIDGQWQRNGIDGARAGSEFRRRASVFRDWVTADGSLPAGATEGAQAFPAEPGRYHLYVSLACPWAHRTLILRRLKGLEDVIGLSVVHWIMGEEGWTFEPGPGVVPDTVNGVTRLYELYTLAEPRCTSRATVPVLWDRQCGRIVSNESSEIIRMLNDAFGEFEAADGVDTYPAEHRAGIDAVNERIYANLNNGVYRAGFAGSQAAYGTAVAGVFDTLDWLEPRLAAQRYLIGDRLTEADIRLFTTLVRFDPVYVGHFKCNRRTLADYPTLWAYTRAISTSTRRSARRSTSPTSRATTTAATPG